jgi:hypothetical protein
MVRYSNESIFSTVAVRPRYALVNTQNITDRDRFNGVMNSMLTALAREASNFSIGVKKFGVKQVKYSEFHDLYNLVQCTPDLSSTNCNNCLQIAINRLLICCGGKQGARALYPSCSVRFEVYPFYNAPTAPVPAPGLGPPPPPGSVARSKGEVDHSLFFFHHYHHHYFGMSLNIK